MYFYAMLLLLLCGGGFIAIGVAHRFHVRSSLLLSKPVLQELDEEKRIAYQKKLCVPYVLSGTVMIVALLRSPNNAQVIWGAYLIAMTYLLINLLRINQRYLGRGFVRRSRK